MRKSARLRVVRPGDGDCGRGGAAAPFPAGVAEPLYRDLGVLGLTADQARIVVALQQTGPATCGELSRVANVNRSCTSPVLGELDGRGLACRLPGEGPARWASPGRRETLDRLVGARAGRLAEVKARAGQVSGMLDSLFPADGQVSPPFVQVIHDPSRVGPLYQQLLAAAQEELLVFNGPPYTTPAGVAGPFLVEVAGRVDARVLGQAAPADDADGTGWREEMGRYHQAGAEVRVVDVLPIKLAVFDRRATLLTLDRPPLADIGLPVTLLVEHPGYSTVQAAAFEHLWAGATPYQPVHARRTAGQSSPA